MLGSGPKDAPALWFAKGETNAPVHIAFVAKDRAAVQAFYAAALPAGGKDNGKPGLRPDYHANYYGGVVEDPPGDKNDAGFPPGKKIKRGASLSGFLLCTAVPPSPAKQACLNRRRSPPVER